MHPKDKILSLDKLGKGCQALRKNGKTVVLTSGCFDLLHGGHLDYILAASNFGSLVVGINSDSFVRRLKGDSRPIRDEQDRAFVMAGFSAVELVTVFGWDYELIDAVAPNIYVSYLMSHLRIWDDVRRVAQLKKLGTEIIELEDEKVDSTTSIIERTAASSRAK
jgi:D-glycero-beta-D-manno-heptose 1-phosphate adenylyltransferase